VADSDIIFKAVIELVEMLWLDPTGDLTVWPDSHGHWHETSCLV